MLNITNHQRHANSNHNEIPSVNQKIKGPARMWKKGNSRALLVGMQTGAATVENSMEIPQKIKNETFFNPAIPILGVCPKYPKTPI